MQHAVRIVMLGVNPNPKRARECSHMKRHTRQQDTEQIGPSVCEPVIMEGIL
jgi:hypothetical protein